jgi:hypothetical protein
MNRRVFLSSLVGGVVATAATRTFPFRVYSFASEIVIPGSLEYSQILNQLLRQFEFIYGQKPSLYSPDYQFMSVLAHQHEDIRNLKRDLEKL